MNSTEPFHQFYAAFKDAGRAPVLIALHSGRWLISMAGLALNLVLVAATVRSKNLHSRCNILIAAEACANALYQGSPWVPFVLALGGTNFIPLDRCLLFQLLPLFGVHVSLCCSLFVGLDRLLCIRFPIWVNKHKDRRLVCILVATSTAYGLLFLGYCYRLCIAYKDKQQMVMCTITLDCYQGLQIETRCMYSAIVLNVATVVVYALLWLAVKRSASSVSPVDGKKVRDGNTCTVVPPKTISAKNAQMFTHRIMKSLLLITCITIFGWTAATCSRLLITVIPLSQTQSVLFVNLISYLTNLTSASHAPVLYFCSEEYRKAFRQLFRVSPPPSQQAIYSVTKTHRRPSSRPFSTTRQ